MQTLISSHINFRFGQYVLIACKNDKFSKSDKHHLKCAASNTYRGPQSCITLATDSQHNKQQSMLPMIL